jgi:hypothetical protein
MSQPIAHTQLRWLTPGEGGRQQLPLGPSYAATARFAEDPDERLFSVVLDLASARADEQILQEADLRLLFPERLPDVREKLLPGSRLLVTEGRRVVAECKVLSVA